ncbi:zinc finger, c3HC4 type (RING finger) domain-containing protein [Phthorimaea operculella]|nr:zinc finger, c3HC4 type (RING finger) domain-containing protein [Phthorimaea operculella]
MGALTSRQNAGVEEADVVSNHAYKYPPRSGNYFGSHFIMGGERFDTPQPEAYLFGENADLNFLGSRPTPFPYPPPQSNEPTKTLKSLVNIRKESLRFVRCPEPVGKITENKIGDGVIKANDSNVKGTYYNIEFTFDCDARIAITIFYFCTEEVTPTGVVYYPRDASMTSQTYHYKKGANQQFCQISHVFDPSKHPEEDLTYNADREIIPIAIYCVVDEGQEEVRQSHTTIAVVEKHSDGTYVLKALKQKLFVDGLCYLLQEIYGIENKNLDTKPTSDEETEDGGSECVICMCDVRDTLILPCRHLCLCNSCADSLRYQANNCPICRAPFRALLQIRALQKITSAPALMPNTTSPPDIRELQKITNVPHILPTSQIAMVRMGAYTHHSVACILLPPKGAYTHHSVSRILLPQKGAYTHHSVSCILLPPKGAYTHHSVSRILLPPRHTHHSVSCILLPPKGAYTHHSVSRILLPQKGAYTHHSVACILLPPKGAYTHHSVSRILLPPKGAYTHHSVSCILLPPKEAYTHHSVSRILLPQKGAYTHHSVSRILLPQKGAYTHHSESCILLPPKRRGLTHITACHAYFCPRRGLTHITASHAYFCPRSEGGLHTSQRVTHTSAPEGGLHTSQRVMHTSAPEGGLHTSHRVMHTSGAELHTSQCVFSFPPSDIKALLQIRAAKKATTTTALLPNNTSPHNGSMENIPPGYEPVSLIEALNGPGSRPHPPAALPAPTIASPDTDTASQAAEILNRCNLERSSSTSIGSSGSRKGKKEERVVTRNPAHTVTPEFRMSVLLAREEEANKREEKAAATSPLLYTRPAINGTDLNISKSSLNSEYGIESAPAHDDASEDEGSLPESVAAPADIPEADSDAERLSPLLTHPTANGVMKGPRGGSGGEVLRAVTPGIAHIDDTDTDEPTNHHSSGRGSRASAGSPAVGEDSDYFTPEDTNTTILVPKQTSNEGNNKQAECTPQRWALPHHVTSLPGTPLSQSSVRSSGDSTTRQSSMNFATGLRQSSMTELFLCRHTRTCRFLEKLKCKMYAAID